MLESLFKKQISKLYAICTLVFRKKFIVSFLISKHHIETEAATGGVLSLSCY